MSRDQTRSELLKEIEKLEAKEKLYRQLFDSAMVGIYRTRLADGKFLAANRNLAQMMGYESTRKFVSEFVTSENYVDPARRQELLARLAKHGKVDGFETEMYCADGSVIQIALSATVYPQKGYLEGVIIDITDRKQAQDALQSSHERFLTVLDGIDATIYVADMQTYEILFMNKHMIDSFGQDLTGRICWEVFRNETGPCDHCSNARLIDDMGQPTDVYIWQGKNPITGKWYSNYDRAIEWVDGRLVRLQIATDITELKRMEDELKQAHKMEAIGTLAGGIAHNFNNLLMGILGRASLMSIEVDGAEPLNEHIQAIHDYTKSAVDMTNQLLGFVRGGKYEVKPMDLNQLVADSANMFGRTRKEIRMHFKAAPDLIVIEADRSQIEQVLLNLFVNAWQAMPAGGDLYLELSAVKMDAQLCRAHKLAEGLYAKISVTDTGIGMNSDTRQRIFDPFFTTKDKGAGTGLGLASAYGIIKNHGGIILVDSQVNVGATFNVYIPISDKHLKPTHTASRKVVSGSETILLVDDEQMILDVSKAMLTKLGYSVICAASGLQALEIVQENGTAIDLIILDMIMPGMDGSKTFDEMRKILPDIPVLLSSGYTLNGQATKIMDRGCSGFIQKPFTIQNLSSKIQEVFSGQRSRQSP